MKFYISGQGKPVIFFSGFALSPEFYRPLFDKLKRNFLIIAPYLSELDDFTILPQLIDQKLTEMKIKEKFTVIGHSMGGLLAVNLALNYSSRINNLIILDGMIFPYQELSLRSLFNIVRDILNKPLNVSSWRDLIFSGFSLINLIRSPRVLKNQINFCRNSGLIDEIQKIVTRTLILWGKQDKVIPVSFAYKLKEKIKTAKLEIVPGNHLWFLKDSLLAFQLITNFINED